MRTIICKKCGAEIDAALGECPNCGAMYYILPEGDNALEWAMSPEPTMPETQVFAGSETNQNRGGTGHSTRDIINADNDELFNTRVWKLNEDTDATKVIAAAPTENKTAVNAPPVRRPAQARPLQPQARQTAKSAAVSSASAKEKKEKDLRKRQLIVAAIALLALLTLVLSIMGGLFNFSGSSGNKSEMPNVVNFTQETATTILEAMGLAVKTENEANDAAAGTVIAQSIKEGKKVGKGDKVTLTISSGPSTSASAGAEYISVPPLTGKTFEEAKQILTELGLGITKAEDAFSEEDIGTVISQSPMNGAKLEEGDLVTVTVSKGPETTDHQITVTAGKGGSVSPKGAVSVADGEDQTFTITVDSGYEVSDVKVDGTSIGAVASYTFSQVSEDHTLYVIFRQSTAASPTPSPSAPPASGTDINP